MASDGEAWGGAPEPDGFVRLCQEIYQERRQAGGVSKQHDEAMRMQALAIGARLVVDVMREQLPDLLVGDIDREVIEWAKPYYRAATRREW